MSESEHNDLLKRWATKLNTTAMLSNEQPTQSALRLLRIARRTHSEEVVQMREDFTQSKLLTGSVKELAKLI